MRELQQSFQTILEHDNADVLLTDGKWAGEESRVTEALSATLSRIDLAFQSGAKFPARIRR